MLEILRLPKNLVQTMKQTALVVILNRTSDLERRKFMQGQIDDLGLVAEFFPAIETSEVPRLIKRDFRVHEDSKLSPEQISCLLSHQHIWKYFLTTDYEECYILEDDVLMDGFFADVVKSIDFPRDRFVIWRHETALTSCLVGRKVEFRHRHLAFHRLHSTQHGSAAYSLNRITGQLLWDLRHRFRDITDIEMFDQELRNIPAVAVYQSVPATCVQEKNLADAQQHPALFKTTIEASGRYSRGSKFKQMIRAIMNLFLSIPLRKDGLRRTVIPCGINSASTPKQILEQSTT